MAGNLRQEQLGNGQDVQLVPAANADHSFAAFNADQFAGIGISSAFNVLGHYYNNGRVWTGNPDHDLELIVLGTAQALRIQIMGMVQSEVQVPLQLNE